MIQRKQMPEINSEPCAVIGILADTAFYFTAGVMHRQLQLDFERVKQFSFYDEKTEKTSMSDTYMFFDDKDGLLYLLVRNKDLFENKFKDANFFLFVSGRDAYKKSDELIKQIHKQKQIKACRIFYPIENKQEEQEPTTLQLDIFTQNEQRVYQTVKKKRKKAINKMFMDERMMENLKLDLQMNIWERDMDGNENVNGEILVLECN